MRIGPERWRWVTTDTPGVATGGVYGDVEAFEELIEPHGFKLAWSRVHECFCMYEVRADGRVVDHFHFLTTNLKPIPLSEEWLDVFLYLRERWAGMPVVKALGMLDAEQKYEMQRHAEAEMESLQRPTFEYLDFLERGRRPMVIVPS